MPVRIAEIQTPSTTINRQIVTSVTDNLLNNLGVDDADVIIMGQAYNNSSQPDSTVGGARDVSFGHTDRVTVEVTERRSEDTALVRNVGFNYEAPLFNFPKYGIRYTPSFVFYEATVNIRLRGASRSVLDSWTNELQRKIDMGMDCFITEGSYHYRIPYASLNLLSDAHKAITYNNVDDITLKDLLKQGFSKGVTVVSGEGNNALSFIHRATATRIACHLDNSSVDKTKENDSGAWAATFTFVFQYARPEAITMFYPVMYNSRLIDDKWWMDWQAPGASNEAYASKGVHVAMQDKISRNLKTLAIPIYIPDCDRQPPPLMSRSLGEVDLYVGYLEFDESNLGNEVHHLFNIRDLGEVGFKYNTLSYLKNVGKYDPKMISSLFKVNLFKNNYQIAGAELVIDTNLDIWWKEPNLKLKDNYRFSITLKTRFDLIDSDGLDVAGKTPGILGDIIKEFHPEIEDKYPDLSNAIPSPPEDPTDPDWDKFPHDPDDPELKPTEPAGPDISDDLADDIKDLNIHGTINHMYQLTVLDGTILARSK